MAKFVPRDERRERACARTAREAASQGIVLLKNEKRVLPLGKDGPETVAVFGIGQIYTIKGGTGSGDVNNRYTVNILDGLRANARIRVDEALAGLYTEYAAAHPSEARASFLDILAYSNSEMEVEPSDYKDDAAALYVISRIAGEGADMQDVGGQYRPSGQELRLLRKIRACFEKVVVILNVPGVIDAKEIDSLADAVVFSGLAGQEGGGALADVLTGETVPSGKTVDTWAFQYADYSTSRNFGTGKRNGNMVPGFFGQGEIEQCYVNYEESIYVGYRYFDTFGKKVLYPFGFGLSYTDMEITDAALSVQNGTLTAAAKVRNRGDRYAGREVLELYVSAPEGSLPKPYQELKGFAKTERIAPGEETSVRITVPVASLASYSTAKAAYVLEAGFYYIRLGNSSRNTKIIGALKVETEILTKQLENLTVRLTEDYTALSAEGVSPITYAGEEAEKRAAEETAILMDAAAIPTETVVYRAPASERELVRGAERLGLNGGAEGLRLNGGAEGLRLNGSAEGLRLKNDVGGLELRDDEGFRLKDVSEGRCTLEEFVAQLSEDELIHMACGVGMDLSGLSVAGSEDQTGAEKTSSDGAGETDQTSAKILDQTSAKILKQTGAEKTEQADQSAAQGIIGSVSLSVAGAAGESYDYTEKYGITPLVLCDGPAGIRITPRVENEDGAVYEQICTAYPVGTVLACAWDPSVIESVGSAVGDEMLAYNVDLWLAPGMNIHRNPLCGRNFEYFSEDPLVTGISAAAMARSVQAKGVGVTVKHFAANNQENERTTCNSVVDERALREIYLKGFEIAVTTGGPWALMSSYNDINGVPAAEQYELLTKVLREEWKFGGFVMTDWGGGISNPGISMYAGNDMIQPGGELSRELLRGALKEGHAVSRGTARLACPVTKAMLQHAVLRILTIHLRCPASTGKRSV